ncbi:C-type lectin domain family 10 member A-like [Parambassis ranga]|uniref:C-type lectin domain family 10 member A-like n=1 Tax=Parambassis ranga TaxID=210632 RepID=A0A6P7JW36_9TELE|nr:C-type lectin domain family 10 member A-like [Parambassis ranga]
MAASFQNPNVSSSAEEIEEDADYYNAAACTVEKRESTADHKFPSFSGSFPKITVCWLTLLVIIGLRIYFTSVIAATNDKLITELHNLQLKNQQLEMDKKNLTAQLENKGTAEMAELHNLQLKNQQLEMDKKNLTAQLENKETAEMELNISRAQWTYDQYCKINAEHRGCQSGWKISQSNCYAVNNAPPSNQRSWEEAREDCRGKISDLVVVVNEAEKRFVSSISWPLGGVNPGYWLGLRVEDGKWKWVDGSDLTDLSWIQQLPAIEGQCAVSVPGNGAWKSVSCNEKKAWLCKKKGLTL